MIGCLPTQALAFLAVFVYTTHATHATQAIAFEWKPGFRQIQLLVNECWQGRAVRVSSSASPTITVSLATNVAMASLTASTTPTSSSAVRVHNASS